MFVRNFYKARAAQLVDKSSEVLGDSSNYPKLVSVDGTSPSSKYSTYDYAAAHGYSYWKNAMNSPDFSHDVSDLIKLTTNTPAFSNALFFGSGTTTPTIDDYRLAGETVMNCTISAVANKTYSEDGTSAKIEYLYTITNNNDESVTIGEIGLFVGATWRTGSTSGISGYYTTHPYLYERTVLESPITIPAGGVGQVTYSITENYLEP